MSHYFTLSAMETEISHLLLQRAAGYPELLPQISDLVNRIRDTVATSRSLRAYEELQVLAKDTALVRFVTDTLHQSVSPPSLLQKDYKAYIMLIAYCESDFTVPFLLDYLVMYYRKNNRVEELLFFSDMLSIVIHGRPLLNGVYNFVCGYFYEMRVDNIRNRECRITDRQFRQVERNLPELGKRSFRAEVEIKGAYIYQVDELASKCNMSYGAFRRKFQQVFGVSAGEWIRTQRVGDIEYLLYGSRLSLAEISEKAGFTSTANFNDFCVRNLGDAPGKLRENNEKQPHVRL